MISELRINNTRLLDRLIELGRIGAIEGTTGSSRLAFTDADRGGRDLVRSWMHDLGMAVTVDGIGNVIGIWDPAVEQTLASVAPGQSISLATLDPGGSQSSACWEPTGSGSATCPGAFLTRDRDACTLSRPASLLRVSSQGRPND